MDQGTIQSIVELGITCEGKKNTSRLEVAEYVPEEKMTCTPGIIE